MNDNQSDSKNNNGAQGPAGTPIDEESVINNPVGDEDSKATAESSDATVSSRQDSSHMTPDDAKAKLQEYLSGWKRALADYENLKKEHQERAVSLREFQVIDFFSELLPIIDLYEMALAHVPSDQQASTWFAGFRQIHAQLIKFVKDHEIIPMTEEVDFDPQRHEAIEARTEPEKKDGAILAIVSNGYLYKNKLLRPAKVVVNKLT